MQYWEIKIPEFLNIPIGDFEGWGRYCHVVYPEGKPEDFRFCVAEGLK
jgi:hypothetical protein